MSQEFYTRVTQAVINGDKELVVSLAKEGLETGLKPLDIIRQGLTPGMDVVGDRFSSGEYFLPHLVMAGDTMKSALAELEPALKAAGSTRESLGTVVIGTVAGDIHEIGKSLVGTMLTANGFVVHDLGVDVPTEKFVEAVVDTEADIVGMSALLTTTMRNQDSIIKELTEAGLRDRVKVLIGGAPVTSEWADDIGADGYAEDAIGAVKLARRLVGVE
ncbi:MAG: Methionine synthase [Anaerolineales bacterium]|nr:Methionine synthase [Anaerolineales bacterium]